MSSWWRSEAEQFGLPFDEHDDRYRRTREWIQVVRGLWSQERFDYRGVIYRFDAAISAPKPYRAPLIYAGGESEAAKQMIARAATLTSCTATSRKC